jgi:hypothetical protein
MFRTATQHAEAGLRRIGAYAVNDAAARPQDMAVALQSLDSLIAELSGVVECFWLVTNTLSLPLTANTPSYDVKAALGSDWPSQGIEYLREAWIENDAGNRQPITIVTRTKFESHANMAETGQPCEIHIDRIVPVPSLQPWPIPPDDTWTLKLIFQQLSPTVAGVGPIPRANEGQSISPGLPAAWNRWAEYALAADVGSGPVRKLPDATTNTWRAIAATSKTDLQAFQNQEHETEPPITASMDVLSCESWPSGHRDRYNSW